MERSVELTPGKSFWWSDPTLSVRGWERSTSVDLPGQARRILENLQSYAAVGEHAVRAAVLLAILGAAFAAFFARRFGDMDWRILTPDVSAFFENGQLRFEEDHPRPDLPVDASEALWVTYFRNIFNPARLKVQAMQSEMPKKYWKNMPEATAISELIAGAEARATGMVHAGPTRPPRRTAAVKAQQSAFTSRWDGKHSQ